MITRVIASLCLIWLLQGCVGLVDTRGFDLGSVSEQRLAEESKQVSAFQSRWTEFDLDGDGSLDRGEWRDREWAFYLIFDEDADQRLSLPEYVRAVCGRSDRLPELFRICREREIRVFLLLTAEADGTESVTRSQVANRSDGWFARNDENRDGRISRLEHFGRGG